MENQDPRIIPSHKDPSISPEYQGEKTVYTDHGWSMSLLSKNIKVSNLSLKMTSHRIILNSSANSNYYFEYHFDEMISHTFQVINLTPLYSYLYHFLTSPTNPLE